ncbi:MAG: hypothetical protein ACJ735_12615 [Actinomycetes bacterium]
MAATAHATWLSRHAAHLALLGVPTALIGAIGLRADLQERLRRRSPARRRGRMLVLFACLCSLGAASVHAVVCPQHFDEATIYGLFFLCAASVQVAWAVWTWLRPSRWLLVSGAVGNALVVALWAFTRTSGVPLGPGRGEVEATGALDMFATTFEIGLIVCAVVALRPSFQRVGRPV